jgi:hypothetical protein
MCIIVNDMKRSYIFLLMAVMLMVSGCDFFRKVAGRPTSADLQAKKVEIECVEAEIAREQARQDSLEALAQKARIAEENARLDSLAAHQTLKEKNCMIYNLKSLKGLASGELDNRYYFIVGSFRDAANADKFMSKVAKDSTMAPVKVRFRTGMIAVGVCPRDRIADMASVVDDVRSRSFCPKDAWILENEQ